MSQALLRALAWDINGSLLTSQGQVPNFNRNTPAYAEFLVNGSTRLVPAAVDRPRFSSLGSLYLEDESINLLASANDFSASAWVKGSSITILDDRVLGMDGTYTGDRVSVSSTLGNNDAQTIYQSLVLPQATQYTVTAWIRLAGGRFGPNDVFSVSGNVAAAASLSLASALNDNPGNYVPISLTFTTAGTLPPDYETDDVEQTVRVNFFVEAAVSFDVAVVQCEPGTIRTSPVPVDADLGGAQSRDGDFLVYPTSPVAGLASFVWYMNLEVWRGDGLLARAGNFSVVLANGGRLRASCGAVTVTSPDPIPTSAQLCVRVSQGLERVFLYVNGILVASQALTGYVANQGTLRVCGEGVRQFKCSYLFGRDLSDGAIATGQKVRSDLLILHDQDSLITDLPESHSQINFSPIKILAGNRASVRMPAIRSVAQKMATVTPGVGDTAKVVRFTVRTILSASARQRDSITINESTYEFESDATPTATEIAAGLATMINTTPKLEPVTASASGAALTVTADVPGDPFYAGGSDNLSRVTTQRNVTAPLTVTVANGAEYTVGAAQVYRGYTWIANVRITAISGNTLTISVGRKATRDLAIADDLLVQPSWQTRIGRNSYFVHHLEDHPDIKVADKTDVDFALVNVGTVDRIVTPYVRITL